ncbi:hypothetical protein [Arthrobacter sp. Z4-13]
MLKPAVVVVGDDLVLLTVEQGRVALPDKLRIAGIDLRPLLGGTGIDGGKLPELHHVSTVKIPHHASPLLDSRAT